MEYYYVIDNLLCPHQLQFFMFDEANNHRFLLHKVDYYVVDEVAKNVRLNPDSKYVFIRDTRLRQCTHMKDHTVISGDNPVLWQTLLQSFQPCSRQCRLGQQFKHIDWNEVYLTPIYTEGDMEYPQRPHVDFTWDTMLLTLRRDRFLVSLGRFLVVSSDHVCLKYGHMPYTAHLSLTAEGSWIYLWPGPGRASPFHIKYGFILILRGDVVHSGGNPCHIDHMGKSYPRLL